jgi:hypothetical protein
MAGGKGAMSEYLKKYMSEPEQPKKKKKKKLGADGAPFPMHSFIHSLQPQTQLALCYTSNTLWNDGTNQPHTYSVVWPTVWPVDICHFGH